MAQQSSLVPAQASWQSSLKYRVQAINGINVTIEAGDTKAVTVEVPGIGAGSCLKEFA